MKFPGRWLPDCQGYRQACLTASKSLNGFKASMPYRQYVGNDTRPAHMADAFHDFMSRQHPSILRYDFRPNDAVGGSVKGKAGLSLATLRYMQVLVDLHPDRVVEIGGGYGGQCLVAKTRWPGLEYHIVDIPEALALVRTYLAPHNLTGVHLHSTEDVPSLRSDFLISDFALSELDEEGIEFYKERLVNHALAGRVTAHQSHADKLNGLGYRSPEYPSSDGKFCNVVIGWS